MEPSGRNQSQPVEAHYFAEHAQQAAALLHRRALDFLQTLVKR
jgi:hypothetical protein